MKKTLVVTVIAFLFAAFHASAKKVDEQTASLIASKVMNSKVQTKKRNLNLLSRRDAAKTVSPAYYIFTGDDNKGFVIISAEDAIRPILAYSETSSVDEFPDNMLAWLDNVEAQILRVRRMQMQPTEQIRAMWRDARVGDEVVKLTTAEWGQNAPFNNSCPLYNGNRCLTGCVATANAIVMKYFEYPKSGTGTTDQYVCPTKNITVRARNVAHEYKWSSMPLRYTSSSSTAQKSSVSQLMADVGAALQLDYGVNVTYGYLGNFGLLKHFDYSLGEYMERRAFSDEEWNDMLQKQLDDRCPILYRAAQEDNSEGHIFIIDGYTTDQYYSVNWGWNGSYNGYYMLDNMIPYSSYDISYWQGAQLGVKPMTMVDDAYVAKVADKQYASVQSALAESSVTGEPVVMTADAKIGDINVRGTCSLDLNGFTITQIGFPITLYGKLTITDSGNGGKLIQTSNNACVLSFGELIVNGGTLVNTCKSYEDEYDYRRAIWTDTGTKTIINGGTLQNDYGVQTLCFNGDAVINGGKVVQSGTYPTIVNFSQDGKLVINDGEFINDAPSELDGNHAVVWSDAGTKVEINGGTFMTYHGTVALSFNGDAIVNNATVTCPNGDDCDSWGGLCVLTNVKFGGFWNVYGGEGSDRIQIVSGYFSREVEPQYIAEGSWMITNPYSASKQQYPYMVINKELPVTPEDVNGDGNVDTQDVLDIYEHMRNGDPQKECDVNKDGTTDTQDVLSAYEYMKNH